jgi:hypothetical protein
LITLKQGSGDLTDPDGRTFYLWEDPKAREVFDTLRFKVRDFSTPVSKTSSGDVWIRGDEEGVHKKYNENVGNFINYI